MGWGNSAQRFSGVRRHKELVSEFSYIAAFSNAGGSNLSDVAPNFELLTPGEN